MKIVLLFLIATMIVGLAACTDQDADTSAMLAPIPAECSDTADAVVRYYWQHAAQLERDALYQAVETVAVQHGPVPDLTQCDEPEARLVGYAVKGAIHHAAQ